MTRLPPLGALRAFESAGRKLSFTLAAEELNVTPGAVSRQIQVLEDFVGCPLFVRANREVKLTANGARYLEEVTEAFWQLRAATKQLVAVPQDQPLRVSTSITFILWWLMPRLIGFHSKYPQHELQITTSLAPVDFRRDPFDAVIRLAQTDTPHAEVQKLFSVDLVAVCSPTLIASGPPLRTIEDLRRHTLLHSSVRPENWSVWLSASGVPDLEGARRLQFESSSLAYRAALDGLGVAIGQLPLILGELKSGRLVAPFPVCTPDTAEYYLIWPDNARRNENLTHFRTWIMKEAASTTAQVQQMKQDVFGKRGPHATANKRNR